MEKLNEKEIIEYFESCGYKVLSEYKGYTTPIEVEKDGYRARLSYSHLLKGNNPILFGKRSPYQKENIKKYLEKNAPDVDFIDVKSYKKSGKMRTVVKMRCTCGEIFEKTWEHLTVDNKYALCKKCAMSIGYRTRKKSNDKMYLKNITERGYTLINPKQPLYASTYVEVIQNSTGYRGFIYPNNKKEMLVFSLFNNKENFIYNMNVYAKNNGINSEAIRFYPEGKWGDKTILFRCGCGEYFELGERGITKNKIMCNKCTNSSSSYERAVESFLEENNIDFFTEYNFNSCRDVNPLPFDFYLKDYRSLIEVDGEQHFRPIRFKTMTQEQAELAYKSTQRRDKIKNDFCKKHNILLLRIHFEEMQSGDYKQRILDFIQTVQD